jgi:tetratricopeptide (TPR) repeat protein
VSFPLLVIAGVSTVPVPYLVPVLLGLGVGSVVLQLPVHLWLEYDASRRARKLAEEAGMIQGGEQRALDKLLGAAWLTHASLQAQRFVGLGVAAVVIFFFPNVPGQGDIPNHAVVTTFPAEPPPTPPTDDQKREFFVDQTADLDQVLPFDSSFPISWLGLTSVLPCVLLYVFLTKFQGATSTKKTPAVRAIERSNAGMSLHETGNFAAAIGEFDEALRLDPRLGAAYYNRAQSYIGLGRLDEALADLDSTLRITPGYAYAIASRGDVWAKRGDAERALAEYDEAIRLSPENATLLTSRGFMALNRGDQDRALADFEAALRFNPRDSLGLLGRAMVLLQRGERERALEHLAQAVAVGSKDATAYTVRGQVWMANNDFDRAIADFNEALRKNPHHAAALRDRGHAWLAKNELRKALVDLDKSIRLDPADAIAFNNRGAARLKVGNYQGANDDLREAIRLDPKLPNPYKHLASLQATCPRQEFRDGTAAVDNATRALELANWKPTEWIPILAAAHAEAGNLQEAKRWQNSCPI